MKTLRRLVSPLASAASIGAAALAVLPAALGNAAVESSYWFPGSPPSWSPEGSWVRHSSPVVADLGDGPIVLVGSLDGKLYALRSQGKELTKVWDSGSSIDTFIDSSPAVGDLNGDGCPEVVVGAGNEFRPKGSGVHVLDCHGRNHRFWAAPMGPIANHVGVFSTPAIGDVTGDGRPDVVYGSFNQKIYAKDRDGSDLPGWPREIHDTVWSSPALADLNGDGDLEIVISSDLGGGAAVFGCPKAARGMVSIFEGSGAFLPGWPKCTDTPIWSSPAVVDVNGDGILDVIVGTNNYIENGTNVGQSWKINAWSANGTPLWSTALAVGARIFASPAVGDVTGDGRAEVAIATIEGAAGRVWLLDAASGRVLWHHDDEGDGGCCIFIGSPVFADVSGDGRADVVAAGGDGALHAWDGGGGRIFRTALGRTMFNSPAAADVDGDGRIELVAASAGTGNELKRGRVWVVGTPGTGSGPWPMFRHGPERLGAVGAGRLPGAPAPQAAPPAPQGSTQTSPPRRAQSVSADGTPPPASATPKADVADGEVVAATPLDEGSERNVMRWAALAAVLSALGVAAAGRRFLRRREGYRQ